MVSKSEIELFIQKYITKHQLKRTYNSKDVDAFARNAVTFQGYLVVVVVVVFLFRLWRVTIQGSPVDAPVPMNRKFALTLSLNDHQDTKEVIMRSTRLFNQLSPTQTY